MAGAAEALEEIVGGHRVADRLRALQTERLGRFGLRTILAEHEEELALLWDSGSEGNPADGETITNERGRADRRSSAGRERNTDQQNSAGSTASSAVRAIPFLDGQREPTLRGIFAALLPFEDLTTLAGALDSSVPSARFETARALVLLVGMPRLLSTVGSGILPHDRIDRILPKTHLLSMPQLHLVDDFIASLDPRLSLGRYTAKVSEFIASLDVAGPTPAQVRRSRGVRLYRGDGVEGCLSLHGPLPELEAFYQRGRAVGRALLRNQLEALDVRGLPGGGEPASAGAAQFEHVDDRSLQQIVFDLLTGAVPRTETSVEVRGAEGARHTVRVSCPTRGSWLRKQASVNVTVPVTTLMRMDERPGVLGGHAPIPAETAREIAAHGTIWNRKLTDPSIGVVLDEAG